MAAAEFQLSKLLKPISLGVTKINVNTELQLAFADAVEKFVLSGESKKGKNFDPRKLLATGCKAYMWNSKRENCYIQFTK